MVERSEGVERIARERARQVEKLGWTPDHDDDHRDDDLAWAAACYASPDPIFVQVERAKAIEFVDPFPWRDADDARPHEGNVLKKRQTPAERIRLLEKAGALIAAEIDRLLRMTHVSQMGEWDGFDEWSENTCYCRCGAIFRSHSRAAATGTTAPAHLELRSRKPCPSCGSSNNLLRIASDPETVILSASPTESVEGK